MTSQKLAACFSHTYFIEMRNNEKVHLPVITVLQYYFKGASQR